MDILGGIDRNPSPRKGRNRTGTMVFSEALIMAEELGKRGGSPGPESDSVVHLSPASTEMPESEGDFVHVDVSSREAEEEEHSDEEHDDDSHLDLPAEEATRAYELDHLDGDHLEGDDMATLSDIHAHVEAVHDDDQAPEQDVTDDAADALEVAEQISLDEPHEQPDAA
jgi:hypothetical protein